MKHTWSNNCRNGVFVLLYHTDGWLDDIARTSQISLKVVVVDDRSTQNWIITTKQQKYKTREKHEEFILHHELVDVIELVDHLGKALKPVKTSDSVVDIEDHSSGGFDQLNSSFGIASTEEFGHFKHILSCLEGDKIRKVLFCVFIEYS